MPDEVSDVMCGALRRRNLLFMFRVKLLIATMTVVHIIWCFTWLSLSLTVLLIEVVWELLFSIVQVSAFMRCLPKHVYVLSYYETLIEEFCEALSARLR